MAVVAWAISTSNRLKVLLVKIKEADSGIDVALTKRYDMLTKLMDVVRAYAKHEIDTLSQIVKLRSSMNLAEKAETAHQLDVLTDKIRVVAEGYPELRSSENYRMLQDAILDSEDHLQAARRIYNMNVSSFNQAIVQFPTSVIASSNNYAALLFFESDEPARSDVKINL